MRTPLPKITLVTPSYNTGKFLESTIKSVLMQDYPNLEYILVDGGSTDETPGIVERYRDRFSRVIVEPDNGHADALNKGFAGSSGEIMGWLNADDLLMPGALHFVARVFSEFEYVHWCQGNHSLVTEDGTLVRSVPARPMSRIRMLLSDFQWVQQESTFWSRALWNEAQPVIGETTSLAVDLELWLRFFRYTRLYNVEGAIGAFRTRRGQRSSVLMTRYKLEARNLIDRELGVLSDNYRRIFGGILPEHAVSDQAATPEKLPDLAAAEDLLLIRQDQYGTIRDPNPPNTRRPVGLTRSTRATHFASQKGRRSGERIILLGNGPSLNRTPLDLLDGETIFACNASYLLLDRVRWRPTYYTCVDTRVLPDQRQEIETLLDDHPEIVSYFPEILRIYDGSGRTIRTRDLITPKPNRHFFRDRGYLPEKGGESVFSSDLDRGLVLPATVMITMMQIAFHLGFGEMILVGCDTDYVIPPGTVQSGPRVRDGEKLFLTSSEDDDPNHFDPRYFGKGRNWHNPNVATMIEHYGFAQQFLSTRGVKVFNATVGGKLEVFPRRDLADIL